MYVYTYICFDIPLTSRHVAGARRLWHRHRRPHHRPQSLRRNRTNDDIYDAGNDNTHINTTTATATTTTTTTTTSNNNDHDNDNNRPQSLRRLTLRLLYGMCVYIYIYMSIYLSISIYACLFIVCLCIYATWMHVCMYARYVLLNSRVSQQKPARFPNCSSCLEFTPNIPTNIVGFRGFDSSIILI